MPLQGASKPLLAVVCGISLLLGFAPVAWGYLSLAALAAWYALWLEGSAKQAAAVGYAAGLGLFGGLYWVYISMHDFGGADLWAAGLLTVAFIAFWALFPALTGYLSVKLFGKYRGWQRVIGFASLWIGIEYYRGYWFLNGFPWFQIGYTQLDTPLAGWAPLLGAYGCGFLLAVSAFALTEAASRRLSRWTTLSIIASIWLAGWSLQTINWTRPAGSPLSVGLVQGNIGQDGKWQPENRQTILAEYRALTEQLWHSDIIVWPETAIPAFYDEVAEAFLQPLAAEAVQHGADLIVSLPSRNADRHYFNTVLALGERPGTYHKNHLLPFGEYLPLSPLSDFVLELIDIPLADFTPGGDDQALLQAGGQPFITTVCYEDAFADPMLRYFPEAAFIVNVTNDAWFGASSEPYQHMQLARMRALETGRFLLRATNTGLTGIVAPDGGIQNQAPLFETSVLTGTIQPMAGMTPFTVIGDRGVLLFLFAILSLSIYFGRRTA